MLRPHKDCYYTKPEIARQLVALLPPLPPGTTVVDPAAGNGSFANCGIALDLHPTASGITRADFFTWEPPTGPLWFVTNPPFGVQGALYVRFFNRAASFTPTLIAFVLPLTWHRRRILAQLDPAYSPTGVHPVPRNAFLTPNGKEVDVPTEWTIWTRIPRPPLPPPLTNPSVRFLRSAAGANLIIAAFGRNAGRIETTERKGKNFYYIHISDADLLARVRAQPRCFRDSQQRTWCAGMPALNQQDVLEILDSINTPPPLPHTGGP